jgi:hypothetical protein
MNDVVTYVYAISAGIEMVVLEFVIRQVDFSIVRRDRDWVSWARRGVFFIGQAYLFLTAVRALLSFWQPSWDVVGLIWAGILILSVNIVSLYHQTPLNGNGSGYWSHVAQSMIPIRWLSARFRRRL